MSSLWAKTDTMETNHFQPAHSSNMPMRRFKTVSLSLTLILAWAFTGVGQSTQPAPLRHPHSVLDLTNQATAPTSQNASDQINRIVTRLALDAIPHSYTKDKDWGGQDRRWDGIEFRRENGRVKTKRKWKMVNHGTWKKYSASLIDPENNFSIQVMNLHQAANGKLAFDLHFASRLRFDARQAKWSKGLQLYSLSAEGHGKVRLVVSCELATDLDITQFPPTLVFTPTVDSADIIIDEFRIDRISKLGGEFAQQITRAARKILDEEVAEKEKELVQKINHQLTEHRDDFRLSVSDSLKQKWATEAKGLLPDQVQKALNSSDR